MFPLNLLKVANSNGIKDSLEVNDMSHFRRNHDKTITNDKCGIIQFDLKRLERMSSPNLSRLD